MAQGTATHVKVPLERFLSTKVEDGRTEKCLCSVEQTKMGFVAMRYISTCLLIAICRLGYAAAFFLLGGALKDAVRICLKQVGDVQLAIALARIVEGNDDGPVLQEILRETVVPLAFKDGNRWLASWAFWLLNRRDLAVRILVVCHIYSDLVNS